MYSLCFLGMRDTPVVTAVANKNPVVHIYRPTGTPTGEVVATVVRIHPNVCSGVCYVSRLMCACVASVCEAHVQDSEALYRALLR